MVINDSVVFIPIPKNASWSVEDTCIKYGFNLKYPMVAWENEIKLGIKNPQKHAHASTSFLIDVFGTNYEYICIIRNSTDRFISAWKYFIEAMIKEFPEEASTKLKKLDNKFIIDFFTENFIKFKAAYSSFDIRAELLEKLLTKIGLNKYYEIGKDFKKRYAIHILSFTSQYHWTESNLVNIKKFDFNKLENFEKYLSDKFKVDFKLIHTNKSKLDYCAIEKTPELIEFVEKYIDGSIKLKKSII